MKFSDQLKKERKRLGLTQALAASLLGVSRSVYEKWETEARTPLDVTKEGVLSRLKTHKKSETKDI